MYCVMNHLFIYYYFSGYVTLVPNRKVWKIHDTNSVTMTIFSSSILPDRHVVQRQRSSALNQHTVLGEHSKKQNAKKKKYI